MKSIKTIKYLLLLVAILTYSCSGGDDEPTEEELIVEALAKTWGVSDGNRAVVFQGLDASRFWQDFQLSFTDNRSFTASNVPSGYEDVWPASGTFTFPDPNNANLIERNDGVMITINVVSETLVELSFTLNDQGGSVSGTTGSYVFALATGN